MSAFMSSRFLSESGNGVCSSCVPFFSSSKSLRNGKKFEQHLKIKSAPIYSIIWYKKKYVCKFNFYSSYCFFFTMTCFPFLLSHSFGFISWVFVVAMMKNFSLSCVKDVDLILLYWCCQRFFFSFGLFFHPFLDHTCSTSYERIKKVRLGDSILELIRAQFYLFFKILQEFISRRFFPLQFFKNIMPHVNLHISRYL